MGRSFTDATEGDVLNWLFGTSGYTPHPSSLELMLSTQSSSEGGSITEPSGGGYARQTIAFGAASAGVVSNTGTVTFPVATAPWGTILLWAVRDTVAGVVLAAGYLADYLCPLQEADAATDNLFTFNVTAPANGTMVAFTAYDPDHTLAGILPTPLVDFLDTLGQKYFVVNNGSGGANGFQVAATIGGAPIDITFMQSGRVEIWVPKFSTVNAGDQISFPVGSIKIALK